MWVYLVNATTDNDLYSIMSFHTNYGWKEINYYPYDQSVSVCANGVCSKAGNGSNLYGETGWHYLNIEVNPANEDYNVTWGTNYHLDSGSLYDEFTDVNTIRIGPHAKIGRFFSGIAIDNLTLIWDEKYPHGEPYKYTIPTVDYRNSLGDKLYTNNSVAYGILKGAE